MSPPIIMRPNYQLLGFSNTTRKIIRLITICKHPSIIKVSGFFSAAMQAVSDCCQSDDITMGGASRRTMKARFRQWLHFANLAIANYESGF